mmetsp:Transcript_8428/g.19115  ORF Transcript_8428/g.19115 Transcript_8428/m.19115 type:complete len:238 (-) Transcript_8428:849-1562(-)
MATARRALRASRSPAASAGSLATSARALRILQLAHLMLELLDLLHRVGVTAVRRSPARRPAVLARGQACGGWREREVALLLLDALFLLVELARHLLGSPLALVFGQESLGHLAHVGAWLIVQEAVAEDETHVLVKFKRRKVQGLVIRGEVLSSLDHLQRVAELLVNRAEVHRGLDNRGVVRNVQGDDVDGILERPRPLVRLDTLEDKLAAVEQLFATPALILLQAASKLLLRVGLLA